MEKDKTAICNIISEMLDNPDEVGIYPTTKAFNKLEEYIDGVRAEAIGWTHADACVCLDEGGDPRHINIPDQLERAKRDLA